MGGVISSDTSVEGNSFLKRFSSLQPISDNDPFWNHFLSFNLRIDLYDKQTLKQFNESLSDLLESMMHNTQTTGNFAAFIRVFLRRSSELKASEICQNTIFLWQMGNALIILSYICKFLTQRLNEVEFIKVFDKNLVIDGLVENDSDAEIEVNNSFESTAEEFIVALVDILAELPVNDSTEHIHIEAVKCLIAVLSSQLYHQDVLESSIFYAYLMNGKCSVRSIELTKALLKNYLQKNTPYLIKMEAEPESFILGFAATIWSALQLMTGVDGINISESANDRIPAISLGSLSILLLLNLACHQNPNGKPNVYKECLSNFENSQEVSSVGTIGTNSFKLDFSILYERLCCTVEQQPPMLLLYVLLHRNSGFRNYVLSRINLERLVIPVLRVLHSGSLSLHAASTNSHHLYLALIVILILSEDDFFCKIVHETAINETTWLNSERNVGGISLGGLIIIVFARTIQINIIKMRDRYLHTNCLAALANMSPYFKHLSPSVCQKFIALFETFIKRRSKLIENMRIRVEYDILQEKETNNYHQDITALEEGIRTMLEICNSCLTSNLRNNPHFIYTILYKRDLFDAFQNHPMFQDLIWNISSVINYFASRIQSIKDSSVSAVLEAIKKGALHWPSDRQDFFKDALKFKFKYF
ncbi:unnamed protein product [Dracunculus medinensis]|uniref:Dymeclin n=1 Tax=Dracunculus medinensis TaxID=318479 RepID=A0A158Q5S2_DRAME|nr:unnamed protein product [Dracunculus medinensis]